MKPPDRPSRTWIWIGAVVLLVVGSVASWVLWPVRVSNFGPGGQKDIAKQDMIRLNEGVELFFMRERLLPDALDRLFGPDGVMDGDQPPVDPWGNDYAYQPTGEKTFEIRCAGPDERFDTDDDLSLADLKRSSGD